MIRVHDITLKGEKTLLRPFTQDDLEMAFEWNNDPLVLEAEGEPEHTWDEVVEVYEYLSNNGFLFIIEATDLAKPEPIGEICLLYDDDYERLGVKDRNEIIYCIPILIGKPQYWGKGYGKDAIKTILKFAFEVMKADRVFATDIFSFSERSIRLFNSLGFDEVRRDKNRIYYRGKYYDVVDFCITKEKYFRLNRSAVGNQNFPDKEVR
ncbi:MAG: GNAT family protein [Candidatus Kryptonium sp.]|nr:GNAT family N-acetyltransferase [Candidatus Kryptonium sp.]MCX7762552.1 GNAT family N-acetyltransferase [Candidatus Kryptonium sp.]MDW8108254.1 GNAT family protein [Candidatus Kryptonium sp.]